MGVEFPCIGFDVSESVYRQVQATNYSLVKECMRKFKTPYHYWACRLDPDRPEKYKAEPKDDQAMINGSGVHALVLQGQAVFDSQFARAPTADKRTKKWTQAVLDNPGKILLKPDDWEKVHRMAESVLNHTGACYLLSEGQAEVPVFWNDQESGEKCKALNDWLRPDHHIVDLKTTFDASLNLFGFRDIVEKKLMYSWQLAHYTSGYEAVTGVCPLFTFIAVENEYPYATNVISYGPKKVAEFRDKYRSVLAKYFEAKQNNWPGYSNFIEVV